MFDRRSRRSAAGGVAHATDTVGAARPHRTVFRIVSADRKGHLLRRAAADRRHHGGDGKPEGGHGGAGGGLRGRGGGAGAGWGGGNSDCRHQRSTSPPRETADDGRKNPQRSPSIPRGPH